MDRKEPAFQVTREADVLNVSLPVKSERFRTLLSFVWLGVWAAALLFILGGSRPFPLAFLAAFGAAGIVVLWRGLWHLGGRETFRVTADALVAWRGIWGIGRSKTFDLKRIEGVNAGPLKYRVIYPSWGRMFIGHDESEIVIDVAGRGRAYGKGLEGPEASALAHLLTDEIWLRTRERSFPEARLLALM